MHNTCWSWSQNIRAPTHSHINTQRTAFLTYVCTYVHAQPLSLLTCMDPSVLSRRTSLEYLSSEALSTRISRGCSSLNMRRAGKRFQRGSWSWRIHPYSIPVYRLSSAPLRLLPRPFAPPTLLHPSHTPSPLPHPFTPPTPLHPSHTLSSLPHPFTPPTPLHLSHSPHSLSPLYSSKRANLLG